MRSTRAILLLSGVLMFMVLGLLGTTTPVAYAVVSEEHVLTNLGSYTLIGQGGRNPHEYQLVATGIPHGNNHITYVKYRVRCNSSYRSSAASLYLAHVGGNPQYDPVAELVNNGDPILALPCSVSSSSTKGQWYTYERTVTSSEGRGNRNIYLFARGEDDAYFSYTFEILEVRYVEYFWDDIVVELTPERYVKITASRNPGIGQTKTELVNLTDGRTIPVTTSTNTVRVYIDTRVTPEKTYIYEFRSDLGKHATQNPSAFYQYAWHWRDYRSIRVPSDSTLAWEAAEEAKENTWDAAESKSAATLAKEARDKAAQALTAVSNLQSQMAPEIQRIQGINGATCTTTSIFPVAVQASGATEFRVRVDDDPWGPWTPIGQRALAEGIVAEGAHTIYVEARNAAGATATGQTTVFKIRL